MKIKLHRCCSLMRKRLLLSIMKAFIFLLCTTVFSLTTENTFSQEKVMIKKDQTISVDQVFRIIQKQTKYAFIYPKKLFKNTPKVNLKKGEIALNELLKLSVNENKLNYELTLDNVIVINEKVEDIALKQLQVIGTVTTSDGVPLPGASILVVGTTTGAQTDFDGKYNLSANKGDVLEISYLGMVTQRITVADSTTIDVVMQENSAKLDEIVVVGYGSQSRRELTGAVSTTTFDQANERPVKGIVDYLQGNASGVTVTSAGGDPNDGSNIVIRGLSTINNNNPIFVVDGVISSFGSVNPNDVKSVTVLKDAASAAIYGARAAGGVVLIETKKGEIGKMKVDINVYNGFSQVDKSRLPNLLNANQFADLRNVAAINGGTVPLEADNALLNPKARITRTDWLDKIFRTAYTQNYNISMSGASEKSNYYSSIRYSSEDGVQLNTWKKQMQLRLKSEHKLNDFIKVGQNTTLDWSNGLSGDSFRSALYYPTSASIYQADGSFGGVSPVGDPFGGSAFPDLRNPVADLVRGNSDGPGNIALQLNGFIEVKATEDITVKSLVGYGRTSGYFKSFEPTAPEPGLPRLNNALTNEASVDQNILWETTVNYKKTINDIHKFNVLAGYTVQKLREEGVRVISRGFDNEDDKNVQYPDFAQTVDVGDLSGAFEEDGLVSFLGRLNYSYDGKYFFTGSIRRDATSRLESAQRWGIYPSVSGAWAVSQEDFFPQDSWVNSLKLRASWGEIGNTSALNKYPTQLSILSTRYQPIIGADVNSNLVPASAINGIENKDLKWETVRSSNFGIDLSLFNNKMNITADYFIKTTEDMIVQPPIAGTAGVANAPFLNIGNVENKGVELNVSFDDRKGDFYYSINGNISSIKNKVTSLSGVAEQLNFGDNVRNTLFPLKAVVGQPVFNFYVIPTDGIFQTDAEADAYLNSDNEKVQPEARAGDLKFLDTNNDGRITDRDRVYGGDPFPDFTYGLNTKFGYKNLELSVFIQGVENVDLFAGYKLYSQNASLNRYNHTNRYIRCVESNKYRK